MAIYKLEFEGIDREFDFFCLSNLYKGKAFCPSNLPKGKAFAHPTFPKGRLLIQETLSKLNTLTAFTVNKEYLLIIVLRCELLFDLGLMLLSHNILRQVLKIYQTILKVHQQE
jgi:hypothetical protein